MGLYIPKMSDTPGVTIPGLASNFNALADSRIVEQGSNENGWYWRWENGLQVCRHRVTISGWQGDGYKELINTVQWIFPAAFIGIPFAVASGEAGGALRFPETKGIFVSRQANLQPVTGSSAYFHYSYYIWGGTLWISYFAIGRWK